MNETLLILAALAVLGCSELFGMVWREYVRPVVDAFVRRLVLA